MGFVPYGWKSSSWKTTLSCLPTYYVCFLLHFFIQMTLQNFTVDHAHFSWPVSRPRIARPDKKIVESVCWDVLPWLLYPIHPMLFQLCYTPYRALILKSNRVLWKELQIAWMTGLLQNNQVSIIVILFFSGQMGEWWSFLIENTLNKCFFHSEEKQVSFLYSSKGGTILIRL